MNDCEFLSKCPVWDKFKSDIKNIWIKNYCQGSLQEKCERRQMSRTDQPIPDTLLPNGTSLDE